MHEDLSLSDRPDLRIIKPLLFTRDIALSIVVLLAATIVLGWNFPTVANLLPHGWAAMKINTAVCMLILSVLLALIISKRAGVITPSIIALIPLFLGVSSVLVHVTGFGFGLENLLAKDIGSSTPGLMSVGTSLFAIIFSLLLLSIILNKNESSYLIDVLVLLVLSIPFVNLIGHVFGATQIFQQSTDVYTSVQTLICMFCLVYALAITRMYSVLLSVPVGIGLGSQAFRIKFKYIITIPLLSAVLFFYMSDIGLFGQNSALALTTTATTVLWIIFSIQGARQVNALEGKLRNLSFRDEMTGLYNYRAVKMLGEHMLYEAKSLQKSIIIYFFDLNNLKQVNDKYGHDVGNELIKDFAKCLRKSFKQEDLVARFGGDEFIAACMYDRNIDKLLDLNNTIREKNFEQNQYSIQYSVGHAISTQRDSFADLVERADELMYQHKKDKKSTDL